MDKSSTQAYFDELKNLEKLILRLLKPNISSPSDLWQFQLDLVNHQITIQESIASHKAKKEEIKIQINLLATAKENDWVDRIQVLQKQFDAAEALICIFDYIYKLSRHLGDTFAWILFGRDERKIRPLTENKIVGRVTTGHSLTGLIQTAKLLGEAGAGFPLIHDITNCLRIGDITFIAGDNQSTTVEVKTHLESEDIDDNKHIVNLMVTTYGLKEDMEKVHNTLNNLNEIPINKSTEKTEKPRQLTEKLGRQLDRMAQAKTLQDAPIGKAVNIDDKSYLIVQVNADENFSNWNILRNLILKAKEIGYASQAVENGILYSVHYVQKDFFNPFDVNIDDVLPWDQIKDDFNKNLPRSNDIEKNVMWTGLNWGYNEDEFPHHLSPMYLYPLPTDFIIDIIRKKVAIILSVNLGTLVDTINEAGLEAKIPEGAEYNRYFILVKRKFRLPDGFIGEINLGSLHHLARLMVYQFYSIRGFVDYLVYMADAMELDVRTNWKSIRQNQDSI